MKLARLTTFAFLILAPRIATSEVVCEESPDCAKQLYETASKNPNSDQRAEAIRQLEEFPALPELIQLVREGYEPYGRDYQSAKARKKPWGMHSYDPVRPLAVNALGRIGQAEGVPVLIEAFTYPVDRDDMLDAYVYKALKNIGQPAVQPLIHAVSFSTGEAQAGAVVALGHMRAEEAIEPILNAQAALQARALAKEKVEYDGFFYAMMDAMARFDTPKSHQVVLKWAKDPHMSHRRAASRALWMMQDPESLKRLDEMCSSDSDERVRRSACEYLTRGAPNQHEYNAL